MICSRQSNRYVCNIQNMWRSELAKPDFQLSIFWPNNFPKWTDNISKDVHYLFTYNALVTRHRISKWQTTISEYCKYCQKMGKLERETNIHAILECRRVTDMWNKMSVFVSKFNVIFDKEIKIFGLENRYKDVKKS